MAGPDEDRAPPTDRKAEGWGLAEDVARSRAAVRWIVLGRLVLSIAFLAAILVGAEGIPWKGPLRVRGMYLAFVAACGISILWLFALRLAEHLRWAHLLRALPLAQLVLDGLLAAVLVLFTDGPESRYVLLFPALILAASIVSGSRAALALAAESTILLSAASVAYSAGAADALGLAYEPPAMRLLVAGLLTQAIGFFCVAVLSGTLARRLAVARLLSREILESIGQGLVVLDRAGAVIFENREAGRLLGVASLRPGFPAHEAFPKGDLALLSAALEADRPAEGTLDPAPSGRPPVPLRFSLRPVPGPHGRAEGRILVLTDLTLERQMEEALRTAERAEALREISGSIAHELRNPLASIRGAVQEIRRLPAGTSADALMNVVTAESDRLDRITSDFLAFARMRPPRRVPCDLAAVIEEALLALRRADGASAVEIRFLGDRPLPARADPEQVRQVLLNLGLNSLAALREGKPPPSPSPTAPGASVASRGRIEVRARREPRRAIAADPGAGRAEGGGPGGPELPGVLVEVADDGPGMDEETRRQAFEPFFTTRREGTGLGLTVVSRIVRAHGGEVCLSSEPGKGTRVAFWLPAG